MSRNLSCPFYGTMSHRRHVGDFWISTETVHLMRLTLNTLPQWISKRTQASIAKPATFRLRLVCISKSMLSDLDNCFRITTKFELDFSRMTMSGLDLVGRRLLYYSYLVVLSRYSTIATLVCVARAKCRSIQAFYVAVVLSRTPVQWCLAWTARRNWKTFETVCLGALSLE